MYSSIYVDVTHRCNMECKNCYLPNRTIPDLDYNKLKQFLTDCYKTEIRFIGGEPTLYKQLPEIMKHATECGHRCTIATNGLTFASQKMVNRFVDNGLHTVYMSMNGYDNDDVYEVMDDMRCAKQKMQALNNLLETDLRLALGCILVAGLNEFVIDKFDALDLRPGSSLEFRNVGQVGRGMSLEKNYSFDELKQMITERFPVKRQIEDSNYNFMYRTTRNRYIDITNWEDATDGYGEQANERRGRLTQDWTVAPFLEHIKENEGGY